MTKVDYATLKKGGFMRQKQKNNFSLRLACVGGTLTAENLKKIAEVAADANLVSADRESVQLQPARVTQSVQAETSTAMTLR